MTSIDSAISTMSSILNTYLSSKSTSTSSSSSSSTESTASSGSTTSSTSYSDKTALGRYVNSLSSSDSEANAKTLFEKLSIDVGGGGKTISKNQLDTYISNAKSGKTAIPDNELTALKTLQSDWSSIAEVKSDSISYGDVLLAGKSSTLLSMVPETNSTTTTDYKKIAYDATAEAYGNILKSALSFSPDSSSSSKSSSSGLTSLLNNLLSGTTDENDDSNAEMIAALTNLIANSKKTSTIETEA